MADAEMPESFQHLPSDVEVLTFEGFETAFSPVGYRHPSEGSFFWDLAYVFDEYAAAGDTEKSPKHLKRMQEMCNNESPLTKKDLHCRGSACRPVGFSCNLQCQCACEQVLKPPSCSNVGPGLRWPMSIVRLPCFSCFSSRISWTDP